MVIHYPPILCQRVNGNVLQAGTKVITGEVKKRRSTCGMELLKPVVYICHFNASYLGFVTELLKRGLVSRTYVENELSRIAC